MLHVLYEDEDLWVLNKPPGLHSVSLNQGDNSLATLMLDIDSNLANVSARPGDAGLINRLDQDTSGLVIGAKTQPVWQMLREAIQSGRIHKSYLAIVEGLFTSPRAIENFVGSPYRRASKVRVYEVQPVHPHRALSAESNLVPMASNKDSSASLICATAPTARRHQIRAHCAYLEHPLVGDELYGSKRLLSELVSPVDNRAFFLHCDACEFDHPLSGKNIEVRSPIDEPITKLFSIPRGQ